MTIYELKRRNIASGGCFFDRDKMQAGGDTLKGLGCSKMRDGNFLVYRKHRSGSWIFKPDGRYIPGSATK